MVLLVADLFPRDVDCTTPTVAVLEFNRFVDVTHTGERQCTLLFGDPFFEAVFKRCESKVNCVDSVFNSSL